MPNPAARSFAFAFRSKPQLSSTADIADRPNVEIRAFLILGTAVFAASLLGLASAHALSVSFWPANAVLVGLALRDRSLFRAAGGAGAMCGFMAADLLFGRTLELAACFAATNLVGTYIATRLLSGLDDQDLALRRVNSVLSILICLIPACFAAGLCGALLVVVEFHGSATQSLMTWPASELVNYLVVLPAILTLRAPWQPVATGKLGATPTTRSTAMPAQREIWPLLLLALSCVATIAFDGPGSIMFPLPALLLCALTYSLPTTALLTLFMGTGSLTMIGMGYMDFGQDMAIPRMVVSVRIAVAFLVLVPLTISSAMAVRNDLLDQLREAADHDGLTGLLNRRAFEQRFSDRLQNPPDSGRTMAALWLDIDHFKAINDRHGHQAGDAILRAFAKTARSCCREGDLVGRIGGEEFALLLEVYGHTAAVAVAERLRAAFAADCLMWDGEPVRATVSIGAGLVDRPVGEVAALERQLDEALYRAKRNGRDRVEWLPDDWMKVSPTKPQRAPIA